MMGNKRRFVQRDELRKRIGELRQIVDRVSDLKTVEALETYIAELQAEADALDPDPRGHSSGEPAARHHP